jgi:hypothetical protein
MAGGSTAGRANLAKVQIGRETAAGTAVAATRIVRAPAGHIEDLRERVRPAEAIGVIGGTTRNYTPKLMAQMEVPEHEATFEQLPIWFMSMFGGAHVGVADGAGSSGYKYLTTIPATAGVTLTGKTMTVETGDDINVREMEFSHAVSINIKGTAGEALKVTVTLQGRRSTSSSFTAALTLTAVEEILAGKGRFYVDAVGGTIGTTQITEQLLGVDITFEGTFTPKHTFDGNLYPTFFHYTNQSITGSLTFEHDSADIVGASSQETAWEAGTPQLMRLEFLGSALGTVGAGTTFDGVKGARFDLPFVYQKWGALGEQDGNSIIVAEFFSAYDLTATTAGSILIVNELATLF